MACYQPEAIVETGTFHGATTEFMALMAKVPLFTIEHDKRKYGFAKIRLRRFSNVVLFSGDSRKYLRELIRLKCLPNGRIFFYLDAHWADDLPLAEEMNIIFDSFPQAIVMIDDFQVPWDQGYAHDDYGMGKALTPDYIAPLVKQYRLAQFYPCVPSALETGCKRGCVVLTMDSEVMKLLKEIPLLRQYSVS